MSLSLFAESVLVYIKYEARLAWSGVAQVLSGTDHGGTCEVAKRIEEASRVQTLLSAEEGERSEVQH